MNDDELAPEQRHQIDALYAELECQAARVGVDLPAAMQQVNDLVAPARDELSADEGGEGYTVSFTVDVSGILEAMRSLPDAAGTSAFVTAYDDLNRDRRDTLAKER
jgi:hypothetical protein